MVVSMGIALQIITQWRRAEKEKLEAVAEKKTAELSFLKAQINPHFLFNTLNNIYSLAITQSPNTAPSIMELSNIMRYVTDDATKDFVTVDREVDCIRDYISLQSLRLGESTQVIFEVTGQTENKKIAPLILMTFIENNFKYGVSNHEKTNITIKLISDDQKIGFFCQNKIFVHHNQMETTGIGLSNTRNRLELAYPNKHSLDISNNNGLYTVHLTLQE
ncbi:sensor histidine kinase [Adhaeribacter sp. BT258]|uniref:Sensor histidine kinase n=1 Tax=Adhaeribacter terrigena TaxID=2793070 RepID=A0ABS1BXL5_9BACT|nr:sensor histidine kinase [Adhaeribacter terrigena]MBK0401884.1 sensor histidine kinase [Adhaeribacter terrigena]